MKKLLLVDDEPNILMTLEYSFKKQGYKVFVARDGSEALKLLEDEVPDVAILDIMMPNVDGYALLKHIKSNIEMENIKVIFLSAKNKKTDIEKGIALGADKYFTKPFSVKKLVGIVQELMN